MQTAGCCASRYDATRHANEALPQIKPNLCAARCLHRHWTQYVAIVIIKCRIYVAVNFLKLIYLELQFESGIF